MPPTIDYRLTKIGTESSNHVGDATRLSNINGHIAPEVPIYFDWRVGLDLAEALNVDDTTYKICVALNDYYKVEEIAVGFRYLEGAHNIPVSLSQDILLQICADIEAYVSSQRPSVEYVSARVPETPPPPTRQ